MEVAGKPEGGRSSVPSIPSEFWNRVIVAICGTSSGRVHSNGYEHGNSDESCHGGTDR